MIALLYAGAIALIAALLGTPFVIRFFRKRGYGQPIRDEGPKHHLVKAGTPTMGGTVIVGAGVLGYAIAHLIGTNITAAGLLVVGTFVAMAMLGFADDLLKLRRQHNQGLRKSSKFFGQAVIAATFAWAAPSLAGVSRQIAVVGDWAWDIPTWMYFIWVFFLLVGASNAVNLTDGLDGLAAGASGLSLAGFTLIAFWQFRNPFDYTLGINESLDVAIITAAVAAACAGFLWHNAPPAKIFMGDTGSLALGGLLAAVAIVTNTQILLVLLGALFVFETLSVIVQVAAFRLTGKRVFRMAPIHHHFELLGWQETTVIVRFWIIASMGTTLGLGVFYAEWIGRVGPL
ncbi:MAG: phospho-N-acetylmuramoyl-pentapeptide-transferase [Nitriliruptoraceae bacterium]